MEMREKVGDDVFLRRKKIENALENRFPKRFRSRYSMVCYGGAGGVSYSVAYALGEIQWRIVCELDDLFEVDALNFSKADELIRDRLDPVRESMGVDLSTYLSLSLLCASTRTNPHFEPQVQYLTILVFVRDFDLTLLS